MQTHIAYMHCTRLSGKSKVTAHFQMFASHSALTGALHSSTNRCCTLPLRGLGLTLIALLALHGIDKEFCLEGLVLSAERSAT